MKFWNFAFLAAPFISSPQVYCYSTSGLRRKFLSDTSRRSYFSYSQGPKMQQIRSDGLGGRGITFVPASGTYENVLIWMHGLGDSADGWASAMPMLGLKNTKIILPTAASRPISINMGMSMPGWFDILGLDHDSPEDKEGFNQSSARINRIVQAEIDKGISPSKVVVAGFSQGGAMALHVSLRSQHSFGGCVVLSAWLPFHSEYPVALSTAAKDLKILQVHGDEDMVVNYQWGKKSHQELNKLLPNSQPQFLTIHGMGHSSDSDEIEAVKKFINGIFSH